QIAPSPATGAGHKVNLGLHAGDDLSLRIEHRLLMEDAIPAAFDLIAEAQCEERILHRRIETLDNRSARNRSQGTAHWMLMIGLSTIRMTAAAGVIADVVDIGTDIAVGRRGRPARIFRGMCGGHGLARGYDS